MTGLGAPPPAPTVPFGGVSLDRERSLARGRWLGGPFLPSARSRRGLWSPVVGPKERAAGFPLEPLASRITNLTRRIHLQDDFVRLHKFLLDKGDISDVSDDVREVIEDECAELARKAAEIGRASCRESERIREVSLA